MSAPRSSEGAGDVAALGNLLVVAAAFEQASRAPGTLHGTARAHFKASALAPEHAPQTARGGGAPTLLTLLAALVEAVEAATAWHRPQHHDAQTQAAALLREAATLTTTPPPTRPTRPSRTVPRTVRVAPAAGPGPVVAPPATAVPPRSPTGTHPGPGLGPGARAEPAGRRNHALTFCGAVATTVGVRPRPAGPLRWRGCCGSRECGGCLYVFRQAVRGLLGS